MLINHSRRLVEGLQEADLDTKRAIYSGYSNLRLVVHETQEPMDSLTLFLQDITHLERLCRVL